MCLRTGWAWGWVGSMDMTDNMMLRGYRKGRLFFADRKTPKTWLNIL